MLISKYPLEVITCDTMPCQAGVHYMIIMLVYVVYFTIKQAYIYVHTGVRYSTLIKCMKYMHLDIT